MTSRERVLRALNFNQPDRAPRDLWALPGVPMFRAEELHSVQERFPADFGTPQGRYGASTRSRGDVAQIGEYVDEWGCTWSVAEVGVIGEVRNPPLDDWADLASWTPPWELLDNADLDNVDAGCAQSDLFIRASTHVRPFERMQFLRGTENLLMDLAWQPAEFFQLRDMIHDFNLRDMAMWAKTDVDGIFFMDDWGAQHSLLIAPDLWRQIFKPMYKDYCDIVHGAGKKVFFHSDGYIVDIYPDLIEIGIDAVNSQLFCMDIEDMARRFKGKITFWGEICRQNILPFGTPDDVRNAVSRVRQALDDGQGGLIAQCEWGLPDPKENIVAVFESWNQPLVEAALR